MAVGLIRRVVHVSFIRFLFVAGMNTCFGYAMYAVCVYVFHNIVASVIISTILGILFNFKTYGAIVFKSSDNSRIYRFFGVYLFVMCLQIAALKLLSACGVSNPYFAGGMIALPQAGLSFLLMRKFVFSAREIKKAETL